MSSRKDQKKRLSYLTDKAISIRTFLIVILEINNQNILESKLSHNNLKELAPWLKRTSFNHVLDEPELINNGNVMLVKDDFGKIIPYLINREKFLSSDDIIYGEIDLWTENNFNQAWNNQPQQTHTITDDTLSKMSIYELQELRHSCRKEKLNGLAQKASRELTSRSDSRRANKRSLVKAKRKDDKRQRRNKYEDD